MKSFGQAKATFQTVIQYVTGFPPPNSFSYFTNFNETYPINYVAAFNYDVNIMILYERRNSNSPTQPIRDIFNRTIRIYSGSTIRSQWLNVANGFPEEIRKMMNVSEMIASQNDTQIRIIVDRVQTRADEWLIPLSLRVTPLSEMPCLEFSISEYPCTSPVIGQFEMKADVSLEASIGPVLFDAGLVSFSSGSAQGFIDFGVSVSSKMGITSFDYFLSKWG